MYKNHLLLFTGPAFEWNQTNHPRLKENHSLNTSLLQEILIERNVDTDGSIVMASGKILEGVDSNGNVIILSVWMKRIKSGMSFRYKIDKRVDSR